MSKYIVVKYYTDGTFTTGFFSHKEDAQEFAEKMRKISKDIIKQVVIYEATNY